MTTSQEWRRNPVEELAEEFLARYRRGEYPPLTEYTERHPDLADEIRDLFPALVMMEEAGAPVQSTTGDRAEAVTADGRGLEQLGDYRILREIGRGGMGVVYEAEHTSLGRHVALKVLPFRSASNPKSLMRFRREARSAARLHHTNIVPVFDVGEHEGLHYFAMQFIQGQGLDVVMRELRRLRRCTEREPRHVGEDVAASQLAHSLAGSLVSNEWDHADGLHSAEAVADTGIDADGVRPLIDTRFGSADAPDTATFRPPSGSVSVFGDQCDFSAESDFHYYRSIARIGVQVAEALACAHNQHVLHRDIKPSNLLLDTRGAVWVTDFGLAKEGDDSLTRSGDIVGTLRYMAPERFRGQSTTRSDIYSLGLTLYEMLTSGPAFEDTDRAGLMRQILHEELPVPRSFDRNIPRDLETIVLSAVAREPQRRYATAEAMADDLRRFLSDIPIRARRVTRFERIWRWCLRNRVVSGLTVAVMLLTVALAGGFLITRWLQAERDAAIRNEQRAVDSEARALVAERERAVQSHLARAAAARRSQRIGRKAVGLDEIARAVELGPSFDARSQLRNEAIAALSLTGVQPGRSWAGNPAETTAIAFDSSYSRYARADRHGNISIRRMSDDQEVVRRSETGWFWRSLTFSRDGSVIVGSTNLEGGYVQVWNASTGQEVFPDELPECYGISLSADGRWLAVSRQAGVEVHELESGGLSCVLPVSRTASQVAFDRTGDRLAVCSGVWMQPVEIWDLKSRSVLSELPVSGAVTCLHWHPNGQDMAVALLSRSDTEVTRIEIRNVDQKTLKSVMTGPRSQYVSHLSFNASGDLLAAWDWNGLTRLWDVRGAKLVVEMRASIYGPFSDDGRTMGIWSSDDHQLQLLHLDRAAVHRLLARTQPTPVTYHQCAFSPNGRLLAGATQTGVSIWDVETGSELVQLGTQANRVAWDCDAGELITVGPGLTRWPLEADAKSGCLRIGPAQNTRQSMLGFADLSRDLRWCAVTQNGTAQVVDLTTQTSVNIPHDPQQDAIVLSPDGNWLVTAGWHAPKFSFWNARTGELVHEQAIAENEQNSLLFTPDSRCLMVGYYDEYVIREIDSWQIIRRLPRDSCPFPGSAVYSPDGRVLALELSFGTVSLIDADSWELLATLEDPHRDRPGAMCFSPDGTRLAVMSSYSQAVHVWDLRRLREQLTLLQLDWDAPAFGPMSAEGQDVWTRVQVIHDAVEPQPATFEETAVAAISRCRAEYEADPDSARSRNNLAWALITAPPNLRNVEEAVTLAETAVQKAPDADRRALYRNTLGAAYYRANRWTDAIAALEPNLKDQLDSNLPYDLYLLAMSCHQLGDDKRARDYFTWARRWSGMLTDVSEEQRQELAMFHSEAEQLLSATPVADPDSP